ncbi:MAG: aminotransferase class I/II-fold pyridoxal phosphate-dependent enzyme, partial [Gemmatimonadaceae bacterium]
MAPSPFAFSAPATSRGQPGSLNAALEQELGALRDAGLHRTLRRVTRRGGVELSVDGAPAIDFSSNDYLGLAADSRLIRSVVSALADGALGACASRSIAGNHPLHETLEETIARFKGVEASLLFPSGFAANVGAIQALTGRGDVIYSDALNHASIIDGCRLSRASVRTFPHNDLDALRTLLSIDGDTFRRRLIVVEGVFSMDGDLSPLDQLVPLAREYGAWTYLDDAHATGVLGRSGAGSAAHWGVTHDVDVTMGTLSKALGTAGAFVAGSHTLRELLVNRARPFIFSTGSPPALAAGALAALRIAAEEGWRRDRLRANA